MKHTFRCFLVGILSSLAFLLALNPAWAQKKTWDFEGDGHRRTQPSNNNMQPHIRKQDKSTSVGENALKHNQQVAIYLPHDIRSMNEPLSFHCNEHGQRIREFIEKSCLDYTSASTHQKYRLQFGRAGVAQQIFQVMGNGSTIRYAEFDPNDVYRVIYLSASAQQFAQSRGGGTQVAREGNLPQQARSPVFVPDLGAAIGAAIDIFKRGR